MQVSEYGLAINREIEQVLKQLRDEDCDRLIRMILQARRIFFAGKGRSGLVMRMFAMRLMQMGLAVHVVGETTAPATENGDILVVGSGSGETRSLVAIVETAKALGAGVALVTTEPRSTLGKLADLHLTIRAAALKSSSTPNSRSVQPRGSLFEQSMLVVCEALVLGIAERRGMDRDQILSNHANLE